MCSNIKLPKDFFKFEVVLKKKNQKKKLFLDLLKKKMVTTPLVFEQVATEADNNRFESEMF